MKGLTRNEQQQYNGSRLTAHGSRLTAHGSRAIFNPLRIIPIIILIILASFGTSCADAETFQIETATGTEHGTITASPNPAEKAQQVTVTFTPDEGYAVKEASYAFTWINGSGGDDITISGNTGTFTIPDNIKSGTSITITATFVKSTNPGTEDSPAVISDNTIELLTGGYYTVNSNITFDHTIILTGDVTLTLAQGATMTINTNSYNGFDGN